MPRSYSLEDLPVEEWTLGLPVRGDGTLFVMLPLLDPDDWSDVRGHVRFTCNDCTLGDDHAKMKLGDDYFGDIEFGHLTVGNVCSEIDFDDGRMTMTTTWRSDDFTLDAKIDGVLAKRADDIELDGCIAFRGTDALLRRDPKTHAFVSTTGAPLDEHGNYTIKIEGTLGGMKNLGKTCEL